MPKRGQKSGRAVEMQEKGFCRPKSVHCKLKKPLLVVRFSAVMDGRSFFLDRAGCAANILPAAAVEQCTFKGGRDAE